MSSSLLVALKDSYRLISAQIPTHGNPSFIERRHPMSRFLTFVEPDCQRIASSRPTEDFPDSGPGDGPVTHGARFTAGDQLHCWEAWRPKIEMSDGLLRIGKSDHFGVGQ